MRYLDKDIEEINKLLKEKIITPRILVEEAFESIEKNYNLNHYITLNKEEALKLYPTVQAMLDKLAKTNIIHKNKASNIKSSLAAHVASLA